MHLTRVRAGTEKLRAYSKRASTEPTGQTGAEERGTRDRHCTSSSICLRGSIIDLVDPRRKEITYASSSLFGYYIF